MIIAVTYENGDVFQHFGHTKQFKFYEIENNEIDKSIIVSTNGQGHGALSSFLSQHKVNILICGGIGAGAKTALEDAGIILYGGVCGKADEAVQSYLQGKLDFNPNVHCSHHSHEHNCSDHRCNEDKQGCSGNSCK